MALMFTVTSAAMLLDWGWKTGLINLIRSVPTRTTHFFKKQLSFGSKKGNQLMIFLCHPYHQMVLMIL